MKRKFMEKLERMFSAVTFAEAGEPGFAQRLLEPQRDAQETDRRPPGRAARAPLKQVRAH